MSAHAPSTTKVTVKFPLGTGEPYKATESDDTTIGTIRIAAMAHFGVEEDPGSRYYLTHGPHHEELEDSATIGSVAGEAHAVELTLVKELIQG